MSRIVELISGGLISSYKHQTLATVCIELKRQLKRRFTSQNLGIKPFFPRVCLILFTYDVSSDQTKRKVLCCLNGNSSERGIQRSKVRLQVENFSFVPHQLQQK